MTTDLRRLVKNYGDTVNTLVCTRGQVITKKHNVMNLNFITILCSITIPLWFTYYQFPSCQLVITRNYFRRSAIGSAYLGPIALSWAFPYWRHRHFDCNPVC